MVFTQLNQHEKQAFFDLLDEYFESRPHLISGNGAEGSSAGGLSREQATVAASAFGRAVGAHARATSSAQRANVPPPPPSRSPAPPSVRSTPAVSEDGGDDDSQPRSSVADRIAALGAAGHKPSVPGGGASKPPPAPARRAPSSAYTTSEVDEDEPQGGPPPPPQRAPPVRNTPAPQGLVTERKISDLDTTSKGGFLRSVRGGTDGKHKVPVTPPIPSALPPPKSDYGPPPMRRVPSSTSVKQNPSPPASVRSASGGGRKIPPVPKQAPTEDEWAEVLYDYNSGESTDLVIEAGDQVLIIERSSEDWWKGELNGATGLFPASYVKVL